MSANRSGKLPTKADRLSHRAQEAELNSSPPTQPASAPPPERQAPSGPYDNMTSVSTCAKTPIPQVSMEEVDRLLAASVHPIVEDPSLLAIIFQMVPPILRPTLLHHPRKPGQRALEERTHVPAAQWENISTFFREHVAYAMELAERWNLADRGPLDDDLKDIPVLDRWVPINGGRDNRRLAGLLSGDTDGEPGTAFVSDLWAIDLDQGWALTKDGWCRLGRRIRGWEFLKLCPIHSSTHFREYGDKELVYTLLAAREHTAWWLGQLRLPPEPAVE